MKLISSPAKAWEEISMEEDRRKVYIAFVYPMIGLCGLSVFVGSLLTNGWGGPQSFQIRIAGYVFDAIEPGSGKTFDWKLVDNIPRDEKLLLLAGGLNPDNVRMAIEAVHPDGVDVSSGVENDNGAGKNPERIRAFAIAVESHN